MYDRALGVQPNHHERGSVPRSWAYPPRQTWAGLAPIAGGYTDAWSFSDPRSGTNGVDYWLVDGAEDDRLAPVAIRIEGFRRRALARANHDCVGMLGQ